MAQESAYKRDPDTEFASLDQLDKTEARQEIEALREGINFHDQKYYVENSPVIADSVYDKLFRRLQELEQAFPEYQSETSPTQRVGAPPLSKLSRVKHAAPMLSLHAVLDRDEFDDFDRTLRREAGESVRYVLEPKFDGVSVELVYDEGRLTRGATRGDGQSGDDVSENLKTIRTVPLSLQGDASPPKRLAVRGEVFIGRDAFQELNRKRIERGEEPYANARNAAAGILRRLESREVARYPLDITFYDVLAIENNGVQSHWEQLQQFQMWGLKTDSHAERCTSAKAVANFHKKMEKQREELSYEIDGIVVKLDDKQLWQELGSRHRSPRWAVAWKFSPREEITTVEEIVVQVGRTGKLTPVALLQPVAVGGVTVSRATLHNESEVHKKDVRPGDRVRIARAGDVIPEVVERIKQPGKKRSARFQMPQRCPICGERIVTQGAYHVCPAGLSCEPQLVGRIVHYASRDALDIEHLGDETARPLVKSGLVKNLADLYALQHQDLVDLPGFAEKSAKQLYQAIQDAKQPQLERFLYGLGIHHVGSRTARILAEEFQTLANVRDATADEMVTVPGIGPEIAASVQAFFAESANREVLGRLQQLGVEVLDMPDLERPQSLEGKKFVFTGALANYSRDEAEREVERLGGRATSSVSGETDYVVAGRDPGKKLEDAKSEGTRIINEQKFEELISRR